MTMEVPRAYGPSHASRDEAVEVFPVRHPAHNKRLALQLLEICKVNLYCLGYPMLSHEVAPE